MGKTSAATLTSAWESVVKAVGGEFTPAIMGALQQFAQLEKETGMLSKAGAMVGKTFVALAEGATAVADVLESIGLLKPKDPKAEAQLKAQRQIREADQAIKGLGLSPKSLESMQKIASNIELSKAAQLREAMGQGFSGRQFLQYRKAYQQRHRATFGEGGVMGVDYEQLSPGAAREQFIERYTEALGGGRAQRQRAKLMAKKLEADPTGAMGDVGNEQQIFDTPWIGQLFAPMRWQRDALGAGRGGDKGARAMQEYAEQLTQQKNKIERADISESLQAMGIAVDQVTATLMKFGAPGGPGEGPGATGYVFAGE
jgi:hypothetical protein